MIIKQLAKSPTGITHLHRSKGETMCGRNYSTKRRPHHLMWQVVSAYQYPLVCRTCMAIAYNIKDTLPTDVRTKKFWDPLAPLDPPNIRYIADDLHSMQTRPAMWDMKVKVPIVEQHIAEALGALNELTAALDELKEEHNA